METKKIFLFLCICLLFVLACEDDKVEPLNDVPKVVTEIPEYSYGTKAIISGSVIDTGGSAIILRGFFFGLNEDPGINDSTIICGTGTGVFTTELSGLTYSKTYYLRSFASNTQGTAFGKIKQFSTPGLNIPCPDTPEITDIDGNTYNTILVGDQCWMKENLKTRRYKNGIEINGGKNIPSSDGTYAWYENDSLLWQSYGLLYDWPAVDNQNGLCPEGWHVPTNGEWIILSDFLGIASDIGGSLKSEITVPHAHPRWDVPNNGADNTTGFSAYPGGYKLDTNTFLMLGQRAYWWSSTPVESNLAWARILTTDSKALIRTTEGYKEYAYSVRCLRDEDGF